MLQSTLGGLPPLQILVGGGEILRDEQIYLAHKCANPQKYAAPAEKLSEKDKAKLAKYKPTDVQLQVWEDLCHVTPTLSFTRPAKYMYRSIAQFGAWLLARAQHRGIDILDDDQISVISSSGSETQAGNGAQAEINEAKNAAEEVSGSVGKAGDPLPPFRNHMIRQRVTRHGSTLPLAPEKDLQACTIDPSEVGVFNASTARKWVNTRRDYNIRYASAKAKAHKQLVSDLAMGYQDFGPGEYPPPAALAGRRKIPSYMAETKKKRSWGLSIWSMWGSKHDEDVIEREKQADEKPDIAVIPADDGGRTSHRENDGEPTEPDQPQSPGEGTSRSRSRRRTVVDEHQTDSSDVDEDTPVAQLLHKRQETEASHPGLLSPDYVPETGVAGKRPFIKGMALPFSLNKEADTASMLTLTSVASPSKEANKQLAVPHVSSDADSEAAAKS